MKEQEKNFAGDDTSIEIDGSFFLVLKAIKQHYIFKLFIDIIIHREALKKHTLHCCIENQKS